jgi:GNAT superfamily N-acetyltransferase
MTQILDTFSKKILDIYVNNFPDYLRSPQSKFRKCIHKYEYYDLWLDKININNKKNTTKTNCLNKDLTYLNTDFSVFQTNMIPMDLYGFAFLNFFPNFKLLHLDYLALDKKYQGNGNGSKYLKHIVDTFYKNNKNIDYLILECEDHLIKFYEKNNFIKIKYNYHYNGIKLNLMVYNDIVLSDMSKLYLIANFLNHYFNLTYEYYRIYHKFICFNLLAHFHLMIIILKLKYHIFDNFKKR